MNDAMYHRIIQFLHAEAHLLDQAQYREWDALFTEDGMYWVPLTHEQEDPFNHTSLFFEDSILRDVRIRRLAQPHAWSQDPPTRTARIVGNIMVTESSAERMVVRSSFQMVEWRKRREQRLLAGAYVHHLVADGDSFKISLKRVNLINCDGVQDPFEVFI